MEARRKVDTSQSRTSKANLVNNGSPTWGGKLQGELKLSLRKMTIKKIVATTAVRRDTMHEIAGTRGRKATENVATSKSQEQSAQESSGYEETWDAEAAVAIASSQVEENEEVALAVVPKEEKINYRSDWIIDSGCSNHMTGDVQKLEDLEKYKGNQVIVTANNSKLPIRYVGKKKVTPGPN